MFGEYDNPDNNLQFKKELSTQILKYDVQTVTDLLNSNQEDCKSKMRSDAQKFELVI